MKTLILTSTVLFLFFATPMAQTNTQNPNEIVSFLEGKWHNYSYIVSAGTPVVEQDYKETMAIKNDSTLTITAHNYKDGKDITRDMILIINKNKIVMKQDEFTAVGTREGNAYYLKGYSKNKEYRFRLYTMGDKYIFHSEVWAEGKIVMMNMSYLTRE